MRQFFLCVLCLCSILVGSTEVADIEQLNYFLSRKAAIDSTKEARIASLHQQLGQEDVYLTYEALFNEYASYKYDSASLYVNKLQQVAQTTNNQDKIALANINKGFCFMSAGLFKESADIFQNINIEPLSTTVLRDYYSLYARLLYAMADYTNEISEHHTTNIQTSSSLALQYLQQGLQMSEKALQYINKADTNRYYYQLALRDMKRNNYHSALDNFNQQLQASNISEHEKAITYSSMAYIYGLLKEDEQMQHYNILAAISDIKNSTKEAVALQYVARQLYKEGNINLAAQYVRAALDDAQFYHARHRQLEISQILPIIERAQNEKAEAQNTRIQILTWILVGLCASLCFALFLLYNHVQALQKAKAEKQDMNKRLSEANHAKEEYIGTFLKWQTEFIQKEEEYQKYVRRKARERKYEDLLQIPARLDASKQRQTFFQQFDKMFLHLFPNFVNEVNDLLREDSKIELPEGATLTTELRIFALMRLGIADNEKIAQVLDYSVNTIYTYKTRLHNKTNLSVEEFKRKIMGLEG